MHERYVAFIALILMGVLIPVGFSSDSDSVVITYGDTTQSNPEYKEIVNNYFTDNANVNVANTNNKVISTRNVNNLFVPFTNQTYSEDQIYSSVLVDLNRNEDIKVNVDSSKISVVTGDMIKSALNSTGINKGIVYVTSPVNVSGEEVLPAILESYESVTNIEIPDHLKSAANHELYAQAEIVNNSNVTSENITNLVSAVKYKVINENIENHTDIVKIINKNTEKNNLSMSNRDIENLAIAMEEVHSVQNDAKNFENELSGFLSGSTLSEISLNNL